MSTNRDPRMEPKAGDVLHKWDRNFLITRHDQGCVYVEPSLSAHKGWVGLLFFREWASGADVIYLAGLANPSTDAETSTSGQKAKQ